MKNTSRKKAPSSNGKEYPAKNKKRKYDDSLSPEEYREELEDLEDEINLEELEGASEELGNSESDGFEEFEDLEISEDSEDYEDDFEFIDLDEERIYENQSNCNHSNLKVEKKVKSKVAYAPVSRVFRIFLVTYLSLLIILTLGALGYLWKSLADYQNNYDANQQQAAYQVSVNRAPQVCFDEYLEQMTEEDWIALWYENHPEHFDSEEEIRTFLQTNLIHVPYTCWKAPSYTKDNPVFLIKSDDRVLALFSLEGRELSWQVSSAQLNLYGQENASIVVPANCQVYCNGILLSEEYQITVSDNDANYTYADRLENPVPYVTYTVEGLLSAPSLTVSMNSDTRHVVRDIAGNYYPALSDGTTYQNKAEEFIRALLHYYSYGKNSISENMAAAISHVDSSSHAATIIRQSFDGVHWCNFDNANYVTTPSEVYVLADNAYCVDISYENTNAPENEDGTRDVNVYRVYFFDFGNGFKIYDFSMM
ncbi:MAG: hypothetical protein ACI4DU_05475 [Lachnospiraceae bacterium]